MESPADLLHLSRCFPSVIACSLALEVLFRGERLLSIIFALLLGFAVAADVGQKEW